MYVFELWEVSGIPGDNPYKLHTERPHGGLSCSEATVLTTVLPLIKKNNNNPFKLFASEGGSTNYKSWGSLKFSTGLQWLKKVLNYHKHVI